MNGRSELTRHPSHISIEKLGKRRKNILSNSSTGEAFLDRVNYCTGYLFRICPDKFSFLNNEDFYLEEKWQDVIQEDELSDDEKRQQNAIWEFIKTEKNYNNRLHIVVKLFLSLFNALKDEGDLLEVEQDDIFGNITEILRVNKSLWMDFILPVLKRCRQNGARILPSELFISVQKTILNFKDMFSCYVQYCLQEEVYLKYVQMLTESESLGDSDLVKNLRQWVKSCEVLPHCESLKFIGLLSEPRTRLGKYPLLLSEILNETKEQYEMELLDGIIDECRQFENNIDELTQKRIQQKKLLLCLEQFEKETEEENEVPCEYLAIDFLKLPIKTTMIPTQRCILNESVMKLITGRRKEKIKIFLFSDAMVLGKFNNDTKKVKIINKVYFLNRLNILKSQVSKNVIVLLYLDSFGLLADTFSLEIQPGKIDSWISLVNRAKLCYENCIEGKGSIYDFFKHGNALQLFPYKKGKVKNSYESDIRCSVSEVIFEDDYIQISNRDKRKLSLASCMEQRISANYTEDEKEFQVVDSYKIVNNLATRPHSLGSVEDVHWFGRPQSGYYATQPCSIICVRQDNEKQSTVIHYEANSGGYLCNMTAHKHTQTYDG